MARTKRRQNLLALRAAQGTTKADATRKHESGNMNKKRKVECTVQDEEVVVLLDDDSMLENTKIELDCNVVFLWREKERTRRIQETPHWTQTEPGKFRCNMCRKKCFRASKFVEKHINEARCTYVACDPFHLFSENCNVSIGLSTAHCKM